jgi:hypothetical protein
VRPTARSRVTPTRWSPRPCTRCAPSSTARSSAPVPRC